MEFNTVNPYAYSLVMKLSPFIGQFEILQWPVYGIACMAVIVVFAIVSFRSYSVTNSECRYGVVVSYTKPQSK